MNSTRFIILIFAKHIFMVSLIFLYLPLFKYLCGNLEIMKVSSTAMMDNLILLDHSNTFQNINYSKINTDFNIFIDVYGSTQFNEFIRSYSLNKINSISFGSLDVIYQGEAVKFFNIINFNSVADTVLYSMNLDKDLNEVFFTTSSSINDLIFYPLQKKIYIPFNETSLVFFRMINTTIEPLLGITTYTIFPAELLPYIKKLQCFCFDELRLGPLETIDLPVLFYIETVSGLETKLTFCYTFLEIKN